ncbi:MAG: hypothetical protein COV36_01780 [Alphaproteobacteria bacterium CG11_big_fil_rev_8_21_14_0_20_44_7]|nr:MAG: hypothetical protein COV36_01780 [Alphaproteobacteria bacterium CG11_big_fil_rev_8_21_14_0_20_44_7]
MASVLLASAGSSLGASVGGGIGGFIGKQIGAGLGSAIDDKIFGPRRLKPYEGPRLEDLAVQTSTYGRMIPIIFGNVRIAGNVIWSRPISETVVNSTASSGGKGGGKVSQQSTTYNYSVSLAIAICEGEIDDIVRVWADSKIIDASLGNYRIYKGSETQLPDSYIESFEGVDNTPAYRGLAYVVIEDFPLADFGNRIPNFTFEVKRKVSGNGSGATLEERITNVVVIPGSGEFVYDTVLQKKVPGQLVGGEWLQKGAKTAINQNNNSGKTDAMLALDQLQQELPNLEWISVVVGWFGDSLDAGDCEIKPGVEYDGLGAKTEPDSWSVGGYNRSTAHQISAIDGRPSYGGTPDDECLIRFIDEAKSRGLNVLFYPIIFMDVEDKPWRGRITGDATEAASFFTKTSGYNAFINHYASLLDGKVDAFSIGSELVGLTTIKNVSDEFPAVDELVDLAASVKSTLGASVTVTYAADWSEYHHADGGWYHLDPLWASDDIDVVGIDAYFPLTDEPQTDYDKQKIIDGWTSGEGYDWYYSDAERSVQTSLAPEYAWKNIAYWWGNTHTNPDASATDWVAESKPIWFMEFGFPSVDAAANQPNVFYNPESSESGFPYHSRSRVDFRAQRTAIEGTLDVWEDSAMVEKAFLWTWDARPYPYYPDLRNVWSDGELWLYGHWVNGKLGLSLVSSIIEELAGRVGLAADDMDVDNVQHLLDGYVISSRISVRQALEQLQSAYFFDVAENDGKLEFITRGKEAIATIDENELIAINNTPLEVVKISRKQELDLPESVEVTYLDRILDYQTGTQRAGREITASRQKDGVSLPIVMSEWQAKNIAEISLYNSWVARSSYEFRLPIKYIYLNPSDVIEITSGNATHRVRISEMLQGQNGEIRIKGVAEDISVYDFYNVPQNSGNSKEAELIPETQMELLDLPAFPSDEPEKGYLAVAASGLSSSWTGAGIFRSNDNGESYDSYANINNGAVIGYATNVLAAASANIFDEFNILNVSLISGALESRSKLAVLNGANLAIIGNEIIQFKNATLIDENEYELSCLLRGRLGTEHKIAEHVHAERFVLLDGNIHRQAIAHSLIGLERKYKGVSFGSALADVSAVDFTYSGNGLKPFSPVHIAVSRNGSGDVALSWVRRTRIGGELRDGVDVPLNEQEELYELDILDGSDVVRTIQASSANASYSASEQTADFGSPQSSIAMNIYQMSAIVGRGYALTAVI